MNWKVLPFLKLGVTPFQVQTQSKYYSSERFVHACALFVGAYSALPALLISSS